MITLTNFQELIEELSIDNKGDMTVKMDKHTVRELIEMLEEKLCQQ